VFEHGCVFVDLAPVPDADFVLSAMATAIGILEIGSQSLLKS
jgi:predicted ATPase